jgi:ParB family chromosome partitioning protein
VTDFRQLSKIATAVEKFGLAHKTAQRALDRVFDPGDKIGIKQAYTDTVEFEYVEKRAAQNAAALVNFIASVIAEDKEDRLDEDLVDQLKELRDLLDGILDS